MQRMIAVLVLGFLANGTGCDKKPTQPPAALPRLVASKLSVLVVDDAELAAGLKLLRGEWAERSGGQLDIRETTTEELLAAKKISADMVIYPSRLVGSLVARDWLRPVRSSVLESSDVAIEDMLPLVRNRSIRYGNQVYSLSLGEPPLLLALSGEQSDPGKYTWREIANPETGANAQLHYPHAVALIVRSIAYAQSRSGTMRWFDTDSMQPRLTEPPCVRALREMIASEQPSAGRQIDGKLGWPRAKPSEPTEYVALPLATETYQSLRETWEANDSEQPLTFLGFAGCSVGVVRSTRNSASAFKLLKWLVSKEISLQLSPRSQATSWFRKSQFSRASKWLGEDGGGEVAASLVTQLLSSDNAYLLPRIPGIDDYMKTLDEEIVQALADNESAQQVLVDVSKSWNELTDRLGRDRQQAAYRRHLGLDGFNE